MSFFGGGRSAAPTTPSPQTSIVREAPGIEERKIELMDIARQVAQDPIDLPDIQVAPFSGLEQQGLTAAGQTGVGAPTTTAGIGAVLAAQQAAGQGPNINQFFNPSDHLFPPVIFKNIGFINIIASSCALSSGCVVPRA